MLHRAGLVILTAVIVLGSASAHAQVADPTRADDYETPRGLAMGSGVRASAAGTSAVAYNPANLPVARLYPLESTDGWDPTSGRVWFGAALADSTTDYLHAGLAFRGIVDTSGHSYSGFDGRLSLAVPLGNMFAIGLTGRYASITRSGMMPVGAVNNVLFERFTLDAAVRVTPIPGLHVAAIGTNLISSGSALAPRLVGGSASYTIDNTFTFGGDVFFDLSDPPAGTNIDAGRHFIVGGGLEWLVGGRLPLRGGYVYDKARDSHAVTAGIGYVDPKYSLDIAVRQEVSNGRDAAGLPVPLQTMLLLGFRYFAQ